MFNWKKSAVIFEGFPIGIYVKDVQDNFKIVAFNKKAGELMNVSPAEMLGTDGFQKFSAEEKKIYQQRDLDAINAGNVVTFKQETFEDNPNRWRKVIKYPIFDEEGKVRYLIGLIQEVTEIVQAEQDRLATQLKIQTISDNFPGMLYQFEYNDVLKKAGMVYVSRKVEEIWEVTVEEATSWNGELANRIHPDDKEDFEAKLANAIAHKVPWQWEGRILTDSGKIKYIRGSSIPHQKSEHVWAWDGIIQDITQLKIDEQTIRDQVERLDRSTRFATLGEMAGGVAHEINTPLGVIVMCAEIADKICRTQKIESPELRKQIATIEETAFKMSKIVHAMKSICYKPSENQNLEIVSLNNILEDVLTISKHRLKNLSVAIDFKDVPKDFYVQCQSVQFAQILLNLLNNACDAIKDQQKKWIKFELLSQNSDEIIFGFSDSGSGIPSEVAAKIFDPLFTTKGSEGGTGLGLSISKRILQQHGGDLVYDSSCNNTRFLIKLPRNMIADESLRSAS